MGLAGGQAGERFCPPIQQRDLHIRARRFAETEMGVERAAALVAVIRVDPAVLFPTAGGQFNSRADQFRVLDS